LGAILCYLQEPYRCAGRRTEATLPRNSGSFGDVQKICEYRLAYIHLLADSGDFLTGEDLGAFCQLMSPCGDFPRGVIRALLHAGEKIVETEIRDFVVFFA